MSQNFKPFIVCRCRLNNKSVLCCVFIQDKLAYESSRGGFDCEKYMKIDNGPATWDVCYDAMVYPGCQRCAPEKNDCLQNRRTFLDDVMSKSELTTICVTQALQV